MDRSDRGSFPRPRLSLGRRLRGFTLNALLVLLASAVALGGLELLLQARPTLLGDAFANGVLSKYRDGEGGIFYKDRQAQTWFMIPNLTTQMYANGYVWTHQTDALGFRNKTLSIPADIVLLGDSYIYGHGVDFEFTVGATLADLTGLSVANLARQGDCALQQAYLVTEFLPLLRPRYAFYFFFENDLADLHAFLDDTAMQAFLDQPRPASASARCSHASSSRRTSTEPRAGSGGSWASERRWRGRRRRTSGTSRPWPGAIRRRPSSTCARSRTVTTRALSSSPLPPTRPATGTSCAASPPRTASTSSTPQR